VPKRIHTNKQGYTHTKKKRKKNKEKHSRTHKEQRAQKERGRDYWRGSRNVHGGRERGIMRVQST